MSSRSEPWPVGTKLVIVYQQPGSWPHVVGHKVLALDETGHSRPFGPFADFLPDPLNYVRVLDGSGQGWHSSQWMVPIDEDPDAEEDREGGANRIQNTIDDIIAHHEEYEKEKT